MSRYAHNINDYIFYVIDPDNTGEITGTYNAYWECIVCNVSTECVPYPCKTYDFSDQLKSLGCSHTDQQHPVLEN